MKIDVRFTSFNKESRKAVLGFYFDDTYRGEHTNLAKAERVSATLYKLTGNNAEEEQVILYLEKQTDGSFALYTESEYLFTGEFTVGDKTLVIERTVSEGVASYTAAYDGNELVAIEPSFTANSFTLQVGAEFYVFSWTIEEGKLVFTAETVPESVMQFVGSGYAYNTWMPSYTSDVTISFAGIVDGAATYNIAITGSMSGSYIGTLSEDGTYILAEISYSTYRIFLNGVEDPNGYVEYVFVYNYSSANQNIFGSFTTADDKQITILIGSISVDDDGFSDFKEPTIEVSYDGKACECSTSYSDYMTSVTFTCEGKTYTAKFVDGVMTVTAQE